jgi:hypothetical protein
LKREERRYEIRVYKNKIRFTRHEEQDTKGWKSMGIPLRVLVIEDSEDDTLLVIRALQKGGYEPTYERVDTS